MNLTYSPQTYTTYTLDALPHLEPLHPLTPTTPRPYSLPDPHHPYTPTPLPLPSPGSFVYSFVVSGGCLVVGKGCLVLGEGCLVLEGTNSLPVTRHLPLPNRNHKSRWYTSYWNACLHICCCMALPPPHPCEQSNMCKNITFPQAGSQIRKCPFNDIFRALTHTRVAQ